MAPEEGRVMSVALPSVMKGTKGGIPRLSSCRASKEMILRVGGRPGRWEGAKGGIVDQPALSPYISKATQRPRLLRVPQGPSSGGGLRHNG